MELPRLPEPSPQMLVGAASPLWAYFGAATAGGVAYWWMTRWTQVTNLEAFFGAQAALEAAVEPVVETVAAVAEIAETTVQATAEAVAEALPDAPVGGESAPISPVVEAAASEPVVAAPEPVVEAPEPTFEATADPLPEPVVEAPEPTFEATADPLPGPVAKPRVRKPPTANGLEA